MAVADARSGIVDAAATKKAADDFMMATRRRHGSPITWGEGGGRSDERRRCRWLLRMKTDGQMCGEGD